MKKVIALGILAVSALSLLASCSSSTEDNLNSRPRGGNNTAKNGGVTITDGKVTIDKPTAKQVKLFDWDEQ